MIEITVDETIADFRIDKALSVSVDDMSRSRFKQLYDEGHVLLNGEVPKSLSLKVKEGDVLTVSIPAAKPVSMEKDASIDLDIVYEDDDIIVLNKQPGLVVHPGAGNHTGTLVNALLAHCGKSLSGIGGELRPGIVHRLDKDTSGLMMIAKNDVAHQGLSQQLSTRELSRVYWAIVWGNISDKQGTIEANIGRSKQNRKKMAVMYEGGKEAITHYAVKDRFLNVADVVECRLATGRTHQIRVHLSHIGHGLLGDPLYGQNMKSATKLKPFLKQSERIETLTAAVKAMGRQALHAKEIGFVHPRTGEEMHFECDLPADFMAVLDVLRTS